MSVEVRTVRDAELRRVQVVIKRTSFDRRFPRLQTAPFWPARKALQESGRCRTQHLLPSFRSMTICAFRISSGLPANWMLDGPAHR